MQITGAVLEQIGADRPYADTRPLTISRLDLDEPGPEDVLVRIRAAGLCHSDLSVVDGNRPRPTPMLLGHEASGIVEQVGEQVTDIEPGQQVSTVFLPRCGQCANCATDGKLPCTPGTAVNNAGTLVGDRILLRRDGAEVRHHLGVSGFATHAVLHRSSVVPVGADVPADIAAVLGCAVLTGGGAVINAGRPADGDDVMVVGLGGVGMAALITALSLKKRARAGSDDGGDGGSGDVGEGGHVGKVIGVDANPAKLSRAIELGADAAHTPAEVAEQGARPGRHRGRRASAGL